MKLKLFVILAGTLLAYVTQAADNVIILKAKYGQTLKIEPTLAQQSGLLNDMLEQPEFMDLYTLKDEYGNPVLEFKGLEVALRKLPTLLKFAQEHPIEFPEKPTRQSRQKYQDDLTKIVAAFEKLYCGKKSYRDICKIVQFFDISVIKQIVGQMQISPRLYPEELEQNRYIFSSKKFPREFQNWGAPQLRRRIDLDKEYLTDGIVSQDTTSYVKGVSIQDYIDLGKTEELLSRYHEDQLVLRNRSLCLLEGLEKLLELVEPIRILDVSENSLTTIPADIPGTDTVELLRFGYNKIRVIPNRITGWNNLKQLELQFNQIEAIPEEIVGLENLERLVLYRNKIKEIPSNTNGLNSLGSLSLMCNQITRIPTTFRGFPRLRDIDLSENQIKEIPSNINGLESLVSLTLVLNRIVDVPGSITGLPSLQYLDLFGNPVERAERHITYGQRKIDSFLGNLFGHKK